jgi:hypothetical protein
MAAQAPRNSLAAWPRSFCQIAQEVHFGIFRSGRPLSQAPPSAVTFSAVTFSAVILPPAGALIALWVGLSVPAEFAATRLHFAPNDNFDSNGAYLPAKVGFNVADVSSIKVLDSLPAGVKGLAWVGRCGGVDAAFLETVRPYIGNPNLLGFYLMDGPDPTGRYSPRCAADNLKAEADWIHANVPGAKTFIALMNMGSSKTPSFAGSYNPANSHVDLFGLSPYPCRTELNKCDFDMIDRYVTAAESSGVPRDSLVPVYQAFGGGDEVDDGGGRYVLPTVGQEQEILARWGVLVPTAVFDYAYSWGSQRGDVALRGSPDLQTLFASHNRAN